MRKYLAMILCLLGSISLHATQLSQLQGQYRSKLDKWETIYFVSIDEDGSVYYEETYPQREIICKGQGNIENVDGRSLFKASLFCDNGQNFTYAWDLSKIDFSLETQIIRPYSSRTNFFSEVEFTKISPSPLNIPNSLF